MTSRVAIKIHPVLSKTRVLCQKAAEAEMPSLLNEESLDTERTVMKRR